MQLLIGHTSQETAYTVSDYPYGFRLRCQMRYWLEFNPKHGYRLCTQTSNPKRPGLVWNKPKASRYVDLAVMYLDHDDHVQWDTLHASSDLATVTAFEELYDEALQEPREQATLAMLVKQAIITDERHRCQDIMRKFAAQPVAGPGALIGRDGAYVCNGYTFWTREAAHAYVFPNATVAAAVIGTYPHALRAAAVVACPTIPEGEDHASVPAL